MPADTMDALGLGSGRGLVSFPNETFNSSSSILSDAMVASSGWWFLHCHILSASSAAKSIDYAQVSPGSLMIGEHMVVGSMAAQQR